MSDQTERLQQAAMAGDVEASKQWHELRVGEVKDEIAKHLRSLEGRFKGGTILLALLELGIERHLDRFPDEKSVTELVQGVVHKVLRKRQASLQ